jgi:hypothetical protein
MSVEKARDVTNEPTPTPSSNHVTASPARPARPIALRAFMDNVTTRAPGLCCRNSSANDGDIDRRALFPSFDGRP